MGELIPEKAPGLDFDGTPGEQVERRTAETPGNYADEAAKLVLGDRNDAYGNPADDYGRLSLIWSGMLGQKLKTGVLLTAKDCVLMMAALKANREMHRAKPDNLVDLHGYALLAEWIETGIKPIPAKKE